MNITFLIGNGFDLGVGMKSKFCDYFPRYIEESTNKKTTLKSLSEKISLNEEKWSYFEKQLGEYTNDFTLENKNDFREQLKDFEKSFINYLKEQEQQLSFENSTEISKTMISALTKYYWNRNLQIASSAKIKQIYDNNSQQTHIYNFICFNYTFVLDKCLHTINNNIVQKRRAGSYDYSDKIGEIVHVHGDCENHPIMGVNDSSQIANKELAKDRKFANYLVKPTINDRLRMNYDLKSSELISKSTIICIYGMALGETDKKWWDKIVSWLVANKEHQLIVFDYDNDYSASTQFDWIEKEDLIIEKLQNYSTNKQLDIETLRPKIHIAVNKNIFKMDLLRKNSENVPEISKDLKTIA